MSASTASRWPMTSARSRSSGARGLVRPPRRPAPRRGPPRRRRATRRPDARFTAPSTSTPSTSSASARLACGTTTRRWPARAAATTAGRMPGTGRSRPSSPSSPRWTVDATDAASIGTSVASEAIAIATSKPEPCLGRLAGERFTVSRRRGSGSPLLAQALCTRCTASPSALSGSPMILNSGVCFDRSASTSTSSPSTPTSATDQVRATVTAPPRRRCARAVAVAGSGPVSPIASIRIRRPCSSAGLALIHAAASRHSRTRLRESIASNGCPNASPRRVFTSTTTRSRSVADDQVELALATSPVARDDAVAALLEVPCGAVLARASEHVLVCHEGIVSRPRARREAAPGSSGDSDGIPRAGEEERRSGHTSWYQDPTPVLLLSDRPTDRWSSWRDGSACMDILIGSRDRSALARARSFRRSGRSAR